MPRRRARVRATGEHVAGVLARAVGHTPSRAPIFVIGTGRSGTHWLGDVIGAHPQARQAVERWPIFHWATAMAVDPRQRDVLLERYLRHHEAAQLVAGRRRLVDKSHPVIWLVEPLAARFPHAQFVAIERSPYGVVASMLRHPEVLGWSQDPAGLPFPNDFLGATEEDPGVFLSRPIEERCALRWASHHARLERLRAELPADRILSVTYESLHVDTAANLARIQAFLGFDEPIPAPHVRRQSMSRWHADLDDRQVAAIARVTGVQPSPT